MTRIHESVAADLLKFGGVLRCIVCGREEPLGEIGMKLAEGWPKCHGYTMRWLTAKQLADEPDQVGEPG